mmetsp:Transcript_16647/g.21660  ORF Transcript_16647/g.21660 Transcript_16647/m.21660 type:complete len:101 (-) Transcript_16647:208-510(-)
MLKRNHKVSSTVIFTEAECKHPFNFWEQSSQCNYCGAAHRFSVVADSACCLRGKFVCNEQHNVVSEQVSLIQSKPSKAFRNINNTHSFAGFCLPRRGTRK